jgi:hypothetical protein
MLNPIRPIAFIALLALASPACAAETPAAAPDAGAVLPEERFDGEQRPNTIQRIWTWSDTRVRGIFEDILPDTQERRTWRLSVQPHFRDLIDGDYLRLPASVIYGFNRRTEGELELDSYLANPFQHGSGNGLSNVRLNLKRRWTPGLDSTVSAATGIQVTRPIPSSPAELNQGANRYSLYFTFARPSPTIRNLEAFFNLSYDLITPSSALGVIPEDEPQNDFIRTGTGVLYRTGALTYGLSFSWAHTVDGPTENFFTLTPSVVYDIPERYTFRSPGRWQLGTALETKHYGNEIDLELRVRVRWFVDFRRAYREWRENRASARANGQPPDR